MLIDAQVVNFLMGMRKEDKMAGDLKELHCLSTCYNRRAGAHAQEAKMARNLKINRVCRILASMVRDARRSRTVPKLLEA
jgi:hypothetical protein